MTLTVELTEIETARLRALAKANGTDEETALREWIAALPDESPRQFLTPQELLLLSPQEQNCYIRAACEEAAPLYAADLNRPPHERELTALSPIAGVSFRDDGE